MCYVINGKTVPSIKRAWKAAICIPIVIVLAVIEVCCLIVNAFNRGEK